MSEYTLENVMCPECGHRAGKHLAEDADSYAGCCEDNCTDGNGGPYFHCKCEKSMESILLHHLNAVAKERDKMKSLLKEHLELTEARRTLLVSALRGPEKNTGNAALKAQLKAEEWRPIEEAPKDEVVVLISNGKYVCDAWWSPEHEWVTDYESEPNENGEYPGHYEGAWIDGGLDGSEDSITYKPTHYRPLPQPPEVM